MSSYTDLAMERRSHIGPDGRPLWNCAQAVVTTFARDAGYDEETASAARGEIKKAHCDDMICACVSLVEEILRENGKLPG